MKLIITGATGFVGKELIRQSLGRKEITSVVAVARSPVPVPENLSDGADASKLHSVTISDYAEYPDTLKREFAGADVCIWTVAVTPSKSRSQDFEVVKRICQTSTVAGINAIHQAGPANPFRFLYISGAAAERDQTKTPRFLPQYFLMRGETENQVLKFAADHDGFEAAVVRPGLIHGPNEILRPLLGTFYQAVVGVQSIRVGDLSRAMLNQVINGFEKDMLSDADVVRLASAAS